MGATFGLFNQYKSMRLNALSFNHYKNTPPPLKQLKSRDQRSTIAAKQFFF